MVKYHWKTYLILGTKILETSVALASVMHAFSDKKAAIKHILKVFCRYGVSTLN